MSRRDQTCIKAIQRKVNLLLICECSNKLTFEMLLSTAENAKKNYIEKELDNVHARCIFSIKLHIFYIHCACVCVCEKHCHGTVIYLPVGIFQLNYIKKYWKVCVRGEGVTAHY